MQCNLNDYYAKKNGNKKKKSVASENESLRKITGIWPQHCEVCFTSDHDLMLWIYGQCTNAMYWPAVVLCCILTLV